MIRVVSYRKYFTRMNVYVISGIKRMDLRKIGWGWYGLDWSGSGQGPVEGSCEHGKDRSGSIKCWEILE
jgi:hypothetical protein